MRIMHLLNHCNKANGHVNVSVDLACCQVRMGHTVGYGCAGGDFESLLQEAGIQLYRIEQPHRSMTGFLRANRQLWLALSDFRPDVVHAHMAAQSVLMQPYRPLGYPLVTTLHNEFDRSAWLMSLADRVVTVGKTGYNAMRRRGTPSEKLHLVENGPVGSPRLKPNFRSASMLHPAILTVCGMHPRKGVVDLLNAFSILMQTHPEATLYLAGEGPMLRQYKMLATSLGIRQSTFFLGFCEDPREYLAEADLFVLASHADPGPLVIAEARAAGLPIVATAVDGIPAMLDYGEAGVLVPPHRPDVIAEHLRTLLNDASLRQSYAARSQRGAERFYVERLCRDMERVYAELLPRTKS